MRWLGVGIYLNPEPIGSVEGECPSCGSVQRLTKHVPMPRWIGALLVFPSSELLACCGCGAVSRDETVLDRVMSAAFLLPFLGILLAGMGTGAWLFWQMANSRHAEFWYVAVAVVLLGAGGFAAARALQPVRRLLSPRRMLPLAGWGTRL
ncbi:MAG: hypothetical protein IPQ24_04895 [Anaeromyxobacter sp.]|nr:hypothetical protein [Anaeromyxobacter sp.]